MNMNLFAYLSRPLARRERRTLYRDAVRHRSPCCRSDSSTVFAPF